MFEFSARFRKMTNDHWTDVVGNKDADEHLTWCALADFSSPHLCIVLFCACFQISGAAWIIEARVVRNDNHHILPAAMASAFSQDPVYSFRAEAIALEEAAIFPVELLR